MIASHTPGPWNMVQEDKRIAIGVGLVEGPNGYDVAEVYNDDCPREVGEANARLIAAAPDLFDALRALADVFAHDGENSVDRFERLAAMFRKDTGYLAPGKDQPMCGPDQPDGDELRAIYDAWYLAKVSRARDAIAKALAA